MSWTPDLETGQGDIDAQHREIFRRVDALLEACREGRAAESLRDTLSYLHAYVGEHFAAEEALQARIGFPGRDAHRREHEAFTAEVKALLARLSGEGVSTVMVIDTVHTAMSWLLNHISTSDRAIASYIKSHPAATR